MSELTQEKLKHLFDYQDGKLIRKNLPDGPCTTVHVGDEFGKVDSLGYFDDFDEACDARRKAEKDLGFHINHGLEAI